MAEIAQKALQNPSPARPVALEGLAETARGYARAGRAEATHRAYGSDWRIFESWCRRKGLDSDDISPETVGLFLAAEASGNDGPIAAVSTIERRLSALAWRYRQMGKILDTQDRHIREVMAGIRRKHGRPPKQKEAVLGDDVKAMVETLGHDVEDIRNRAILLVGFAGGLRRSEVRRSGLRPGSDRRRPRLDRDPARRHAGDASRQDRVA